MTAATAATAATARKLKGFDFFRQTLRSARHVVAPMVDQSELPWRLLSRRHGADLVYTPMIHARIFSEATPAARRQCFAPHPEDRPVIVQFCANDPATLLAAARHVERDCDAVDINLGCPQGIAKRGHYGSFLQDEWELIAQMVSLLDRELGVPVTCKIRVFPDVQRTIAYAQMLEAAGCQLLTVHGRTREMKGHHTGLADWTQIAAVRAAVKIPVYANGNILYYPDVERCIAATGVQGVMTAEGNLFNPAIFEPMQLPAVSLAREYLAICENDVDSDQWHMGQVKAHLFKLFHKVLPIYTTYRDQLASLRDMATAHQIVDGIEQALAASSASSASAASAASPEHPVAPGDLTTPVDVRTLTRNAAGLYDLPLGLAQPYFRPALPPISDEKRKLADALNKAALDQQRKKPKVVKPTCAFEGCANVPSDTCASRMCKKCCKTASEDPVAQEAAVARLPRDAAGRILLGAATALPKSAATKAAAAAAISPPTSASAAPRLLTDKAGLPRLWYCASHNIMLAQEIRRALQADGQVAGLEAAAAPEPARAPDARIAAGEPASREALASAVASSLGPSAPAGRV